MRKILIAALLTTAFAIAGLAQESPTDEEALTDSAEEAGEVAEVPEGDESDAAVADEEDEIDLDNPEDADLDEQTYEEDDDDFVSSEEIPADEPVPFPSNI